jgi:hypothetical protein
MQHAKHATLYWYNALHTHGDSHGMKLCLIQVFQGAGSNTQYTPPTRPTQNLALSRKSNHSMSPEPHCTPSAPPVQAPLEDPRHTYHACSLPPKGRSCCTAPPVAITLTAISRSQCTAAVPTEATAESMAPQFGRADTPWQKMQVVLHRYPARSVFFHVLSPRQAQGVLASPPMVSMLHAKGRAAKHIFVDKPSSKILSMRGLGGVGRPG